MWSIFDINPLIYTFPFIAFLAGSIPFGIIFTKRTGIDIRKTGSKNIGATNVLRSAGKLPAFLTLICDVLKGALPVLLCTFLLEKFGISKYQKEFWIVITGLSAVAGHIFSVFLSFRGGKGVATGFGVISVIRPSVALILLLIWLGVAFITRYSSLAAIISICSLPIIFVIRNESPIMLVFSIAVGSMIIMRHSSNIKRLLRGEEAKIGEK
jgi:glycerol-3-phosphate acyltransferase PlsY